MAAKRVLDAMEHQPEKSLRLEKLWQLKLLLGKENSSVIWAVVAFMLWTPVTEGLYAWVSGWTFISGWLTASETTAIVLVLIQITCDRAADRAARLCDRSNAGRDRRPAADAGEGGACRLCRRRAAPRRLEPRQRVELDPRRRAAPIALVVSLPFWVYIWRWPADLGRAHRLAQPARLSATTR